MANSIEWDTTELTAGMTRYTEGMSVAAGIGLMRISDELLRLSAKEVPHDKGLLQNSAEQEKVSDEEVIVGYNKEYAAYQHEGEWPDGSHPIKNHSKPGRKTKYLIDPLKNNFSVFDAVFQEATGNHIASL